MENWPKSFKFFCLLNNFRTDLAEIDEKLTKILEYFCLSNHFRTDLAEIDEKWPESLKKIWVAAFDVIINSQSIKIVEYLKLTLNCGATNHCNCISAVNRRCEIELMAKAKVSERSLKSELHQQRLQRLQRLLNELFFKANKKWKKGKTWS